MLLNFNINGGKKKSIIQKNKNVSFHILLWKYINASIIYFKKNEKLSKGKQTK